MARGKVGQGAALGKFVPGAGELAVVAAIDAVANQGAQFGRYAACVLDGEVGDAAPRIKPPRGNDGARGAGADAGLAVAAMGAGGRRSGQSHVDIDFAQKEGAACLFIDEQSVLAAPAQATAAGKLYFKHGSRVGKHTVPERANVGGNGLGELLQALAHDLVVVAPTGVK